MALMLLRVALLAVIAAAADDVPVTWWTGQRMSLPCAAPHAERLQLRRPPPPLEADERPRTRPYVWTRDNVDINSKRILPSGALEVARRRDGEGVYQCLVRHHGGLVMGYPIHLKIATIEKQFSVHPENATARSGQPFILTCSISSAPPASISWLRDDLPLPEDDRYHIIQNQLLITDITSADSGSYRCIATNSHFNKSRTSHAGTLEVASSGEDQTLDFLPIEYDSDVLAPQGSRVVLPCPVVGWPRSKLIWHWSPPGHRTRELDVTDEVLVLRSLQPDQQGSYSCAVEDLPHRTKTFTVTLTEPAVITIPPSSKEALRASTVRFNCTAVGSPAPNITWYKDGKPLLIAGTINLRKSTDGQRTELVVSGVDSEDAGVYQCFAHNVVSSDSAWATLNVTGADAAAPMDVHCWALGDRKIKVSWKEPELGTVVAYTVHGTPVEDKAYNALPGNPLTNTEEVVTVAAPLIPYKFSVKAYSQLSAFIKNAVSDLSVGAECQGQGVPIKLVKLNDTSVLVTWKSFTEEFPGVLEWILQYKADEDSVEHNVTLDGSVYNYTLSATPSSPLLVRLLGTRSRLWARQDLTLVPWSSTAAAHTQLEAGEVIAAPYDVSVSGVWARRVALRWRGAADPAHSYRVCARAADEKFCHTFKETSGVVPGLQPGTQYEVTVQALSPRAASPSSWPLVVSTPTESPQRFKELSGRFINSSTLQVSWNGAPGKYRVHYSAQLKLPVEQWDSIDTTDTNTVLIPGIDPTEKTYLMVTGYDPEEHSKIVTILPLFKDLEAKDIQFEYTRSGVRVWWSGEGPKVVIYAQNITRPVEQWTSITASDGSVELTDLDQSLPTFVMVSSNKKQRSQVLTINPRPVDNSSLYLGVGIAVGVLILSLVALAAACVWRKRKMSRSPTRSRRRNAASNEDSVEEEAEMKVRPVAARGVRGAGAGAVAGAGPANGAPRGAAEPLLNGHVHITENPTSKTPNGKMKKGRRYEAAFDVSRYEDTTQETILADTSASFPLDTSRGPELDVSRSSREMTTNNSFSKLPDDNMNSELTRSTFQLDNSKIQPTLQPNG